MRDLGGRRARVGALALAVLIGGGLTACGDDEDPYADEEFEEPIRGGLDNETVIADPATTVEGLTLIKEMVNDLVDKIGTEEAIYDNEAILPVWEDVEGRVKLEDPTTHQTLEAQFLALTDAVEKNDKAAGRTAGDAIISAIDAYLAKPRTTPSPSVSPDPSSTAIPTSTATSVSTATPLSVVPSATP